ncbi:hypothetical protein EF847_05090 [Actinobacteria bacterium YIM 96077]|uniref:Transglycosylase SLT domain-containing protein n=1 Tax=Phytoactinopolyspora halophila TaxID=1981511 RepID=A0A329R1P9_9ACTN|nr:hypothetical protein [Phytoactinopolyspora halophila]AYY12172.1 hypothetical protein EF847_05090 [Actinobacteria bacterium YIM 96077]RAW18594.1 hypothetical protein DPM12_00425 [Phytoactinopolyspora halophila]
MTVASTRIRRLAATVTVTSLTGLMLSVQPATAEAPAPIPDNPADKDAAGPMIMDDEATADELKRANAWVPQSQQLQFGAEPLSYVEDAAARAASEASCSVSDNAATALVIAMTWPEVAPSGEPPSPMTLSRYDTQSSLGDPQNRASGLWFHPGIGMWQLDSAGLGTNVTAGEAIDSKLAAERMAPFIVGKYCDRINSGASAAAARSHAWTDWVACNDGACEDTYQRALSGVTPVEGVGRYGGADMRRCWYQGAAHDCVFVDPANARGADWWASPSGGRSPLAAPFYVIRLDTSPTTELRYWLSGDSGANTDVEARRPFGSNARGGLTWSNGPGLCDMTEQRGDC